MHTSYTMLGILCK